MCRILYFDTDKSKAQKIRSLIEKGDFKMESPETASGVIDVINTKNVDFLVIDIEEYAKQANLGLIKRFLEHRQIPVFYIISHPESKFSPLNDNFDADDIILKPYREEEVALRIIHRLKKLSLAAPEKKELEKLDVLLKIGSLTFSSLTPEETCRRVLETVSGLFECKTAAIYLCNEEEQRELAGYFGDADEEDLKNFLHMTYTLDYLSSQINFIEDLSRELFWDKVDWKNPEHFKNTIQIPLVADEKLLGIMMLFNVKDELKKKFNGEDKPFLLQMTREIQNVIHMSVQMSQINKNLELAMGELSILYEISDALSSTLNLDELLHLIVRNAARSFNAQVVSLMMLDKEKQELSIRCSEGLSQEITKTTKLKIGDGIAGRVAKTGQPLLLVDVGGLNALDIAGDIKSALSVPLKIKDEVIGVLNVSKTSRYRFTEADLKLLFNLASLAAQAIEKAALYQDLKNSLEEVKNSYMSTVKALSRAIEAKDPYTQGHVDRVAKYGLAIAMELDPDMIKDDMFRYALVLHDIGKIEIPDAILTKSGVLSEEEKAIMRRHPEVGARILQPVQFLHEAARMIRFHQERWDGKGYPDGLKGEEIPLVARIISVADAFDAITTDRPYRPAQPVDYARKEIEKGSGAQFDPKVVKAFLSALDKKVIP